MNCRVVWHALLAQSITIARLVVLCRRNVLQARRSFHRVLQPSTPMIATKWHLERQIQVGGLRSQALPFKVTCIQVAPHICKSSHARPVQKYHRLLESNMVTAPPVLKVMHVHKVLQDLQLQVSVKKLYVHQDTFALLERWTCTNTHAMVVLITLRHNSMTHLRLVSNVRRDSTAHLAPIARLSAPMDISVQPTRKT